VFTACRTIWRCAYLSQTFGQESCCEFHGLCWRYTTVRGVRRGQSSGWFRCSILCGMTQSHRPHCVALQRWLKFSYTPRPVQLWGTEKWRSIAGALSVVRTVRTVHCRKRPKIATLYLQFSRRPKNLDKKKFKPIVLVTVGPCSRLFVDGMIVL